MTKQKKNELKEEEEGEEDRTYGAYGTYGINETHVAYEVNESNDPIGKSELTADHTSHVPHTTHVPHSSPQKALYAIVREALAQGQKIPLPGLGLFSVELHAARMGRNPRTGESIAIPARRRIHFKATKGFRQLLNT